MASNTKHSDTETRWRPYQAEVTRLYRDENRTLKEVMRALESQYGFKAT